MNFIILRLSSIIKTLPNSDEGLTSGATVIFYLIQLFIYKLKQSHFMKAKLFRKKHTQNKTYMKISTHEDRGAFIFFAHGGVPNFIEQCTDMIQCPLYRKLKLHNHPFIISLRNSTGLL